jgi:hypothetical protein
MLLINIMISQKIQYVFFLITIILFAVVGFFIFYQQKTINSLNRNLSSVAQKPIASTSQELIIEKEPAAQQLKLNDDTVKTIKDKIVSNSTDLIGEVSEVNKNFISIKADVIDLEKIKDATSTDFKTYPKIMKFFYILVSNNTKVEPKKIGDIATGSPIKVILKSSYYSNDPIIASNIIFPYITIDHDIKPGNKFINGKIMKIVSGQITVKSINPNDLSEKTYSVKITPETRFIRSDFSNPPIETEIKFDIIREGDSVTALTEEPIGNKTEIQAKVFKVMDLSKAIKNQTASSTKGLKKR